MSNLKQKVDALDSMVSQGQIIQALEEFFHPEIRTQEGNGDISSGKADKKTMLEGFFSGISSVNEIKLHSNAVGDDVTLSEFTIDLTQNDGSPILWNEVIRRQWKDGLVINERYYTA